MASPNQSSPEPGGVGGALSDSDVGSFPPLQSNPHAPVEDEVAQPYVTHATRQDVSRDDSPTSHSLSGDADLDAATEPAMPAAAPASPSASAAAKSPSGPAPASPTPALKSEAEADAATLADLLAAHIFEPVDEAGQRQAALALLDKRYAILRKLGEGGMGVVYLAYDRLGDCNVAIKTLRPKFLNDEPSRKRFIDEAKQMNKVPSHCHVLVVKGLGTENRPYYVMENMPGGSLGKLIRKDGPLPRERILQLATDIAKAVEYLHESSGQIHRDIKPENVLLAKDGSAWLCDFGLIRAVGIGAQGLRAGTLAYMPPEIVSDLTKNVGFDWDIYSYGAVLYEMLCGKRPYDELFNAKSHPLEQMKLMKEEVLKRPPLPIAQVHRKADASLAKIANWCMAREARERYYRMGDVMADLERVKQGKAPLGPKQKADQAAGGRSKVPGLIGLAAILAIAGAVIWFVNPGGLRDDILLALSPGGVTGTDGPRKDAGKDATTKDAIAKDGDAKDSTGKDASTKDSGTANIKPAGVDTKTGNAIIDAVNPKPPFKVKIVTEQGRNLLVEGEVVHFVVEADRECYLTVMLLNLGHGDEEVAELMPSLYQTAGPFKAGEKIHVPPLEGDERRIIRIQPPHGQMLVKVIASTKPFHLVVPGLTDVEGYRMLERKNIKVSLPGKPDVEFESMDKALNADEWSTAELLITTTAVK